MQKFLTSFQQHCVIIHYDFITMVYQKNIPRELSTAYEGKHVMKKYAIFICRFSKLCKDIMLFFVKTSSNSNLYFFFIWIFLYCWWKTFSIWKNLNPFHPGILFGSVEIGPVVLEKKIFKFSLSSRTNAWPFIWIHPMMFGLFDSLVLEKTILKFRQCIFTIS